MALQLFYYDQVIDRAKFTLKMLLLLGLLRYYYMRALSIVFFYIDRVKNKIMRFNYVRD